MAAAPLGQATLDQTSHENENYSVLLGKIQSRQARVSIIGLGYVGLPLAVAFANAGYQVVGIDVDQARTDAINRGESQIGDVSSETLTTLTSSKRVRSLNGDGSPNSKNKGSLKATTDSDVLSDPDVAIICVPTPLGKTRDPDVSYIVTAAEAIVRRLHPGMLIVLESTTYPGTTEEVILPILEREGYLGSVGGTDVTHTLGRDFFLAFSPERIDPANKEWTVVNTPKVVGGITSHCTDLEKNLYECAVPNVVPVSSTKVAEMVKLLENTFRATNIALVNEIAIMCDRLGVDVWEVIDAAKTKPFGFMPFYPGPGLGGHCIPIDPQYLAWKMRTLNYNPRFIQLAEEINFGMPQYVVDKITDALNEDSKSLKGSRILVLGVAYKADVSDVRESPALEIIRLLQLKKAEVSYHDPYVAEITFDGVSMKSIRIDEKALMEADCVVIATAHKSYDWSWIVNHAQRVFDTRNATAVIDSTGDNVVSL